MKNSSKLVMGLAAVTLFVLSSCGDPKLLKEAHSIALVGIKFNREIPTMSKSEFNGVEKGSNSGGMGVTGLMNLLKI